MAKANALVESELRHFESVAESMRYSARDLQSRYNRTKDVPAHVREILQEVTAILGAINGPQPKPKQPEQPDTD